MVFELLLEKGGVIMTLLLCLSVYVVAIIIYKLFQFYLSKVFAPAAINEGLASYKNGNLSKAKQAFGASDTPLSRLALLTVNLLDDSSMDDEQKKERIRYEAEKSIRPFYGHLRGLEMVANVGPLLGLLGTVVGMVKAFAGIGDLGGRVDPSILAGGIWEALLTTVAGLAVAIPALVTHYVVDSRIDKVHGKVHDLVSELWTYHDKA